MTSVSLSALLDARNESLAVKRSRPAWHVRALKALRRVDWAPVTARVALVLLTLAGFGSRHGLVLAGCAAFVTAAAMLTPVAGWAVAGVALFFLEARRR